VVSDSVTSDECWKSRIRYRQAWSADTYRVALVQVLSHNMAGVRTSTSDKRIEPMTSSASTVRSTLEGLTIDEVLGFERELMKRHAESYRWDLWATRAPHHPA
jgi:hypothetical protein